jgi:hypothetical protein
MSRGQEGGASDTGAPVAVEYSRNQIGVTDGSPSAAQLGAGSTGTTSDGASNGSGDDKAPASAPLAAPASVKADSKISGEDGKAPTAETESDTTSSAAIKDNKKNDIDSSRALAKPSASSPAAVASKNRIPPKSGDAMVRKTAPSTMSARSAELTRPAYRPRGAVEYRSWRSKSADGSADWVGPPPVIYGLGPEASARYVIDPADGMKRQDRMPLPAKPSIWQRVVDAPGAVLNTGKQALYGILDSVW